MAKAPYSQALLERAQAHVQRPLTDRRYAEGLAEIAQLYADITGEPVGKCRQCQYKDFLAVVTAYIREATRSLHPELMPETQYTFAPGFAGEVIADGRYNKTVTAENLTDQDAEALLKLGYGHVIVAKPGTEATASTASASEAGESEPADEETEPSEREQELEAKLEQSTQAFDNEVTAHKATTDALYKERTDHATTRAQLTDTQQKLDAATKKLSRKTAAVGATDPALVPAVSTGDGTATPSTPAVSAPAPPTAPAEGTSGN